MANGEAVLFGFEKHSQLKTHTLLHELTVHLLAKLACLVGSAGFDSVAVLHGHLVGRGAGASGIGEDMHFGEGALLDEGKGVLVVLFGFTGEACNQIAGKSAAGEVFSQILGGLEEVLGVVLAVHGLESSVAAGLERQVEVGANSAAFCQATAEIFGDDGGFQRTKADSHVTGGLCTGFDNVCQVGLAGQVKAVGSYLNAGEDDFLVAQGGNAGGFRGGIGNGQTSQATSGVGDDAVAAEVDATILNFQHGAGSAGDSACRQLLKVKALEGLVNIGAFLALGGSGDNSFNKVDSVGCAKDDLCADFLGLLGAYLRIAAADGYDAAGVFVSETADGLAGFSATFGSDGTGVDNDNVCKLTGCCRVKTTLLQNALHGLCFILVDLTAKSRYNIFHRVLQI